MYYRLKQTLPIDPLIGKDYIINALQAIGNYISD